MKPTRDVPVSVLDLGELVEQVEERRKALDAIESASVLVEFEVAGNWFGGRWGRDRRFSWGIYAALWDSQGQWVDHLEELVGRSRGSSTWRPAQPPADALSAAEAFVLRHLFAEL